MERWWLYKADMSRRSFSGAFAAALLASSDVSAQTAEPPGDSRLIQHANAPEARARLMARDWSGLAELVRALSPDSACVLLYDLGDATNVDLDLSGLIGFPMGHTIAGSLWVNWGWRYRGSGAGSTVTGAMLEAFRERLSLARESLEHGIDADAHDGVAYNHLIRTLKGQSEVGALQSVWMAFQDVDRKPIRAYAGFADALSAKWFGTHELMLQFALTYQRALEPASHALVAQALNEFVLAQLRRRGGPSMDINPEAITLVVAANDAFLAAPPPADRYQALFAHYHFSFLFAMIGMNDIARPHIVAMDGAVGGPWALLSDPFATLEAYRSTLGISET